MLKVIIESDVKNYKFEHEVGIRKSITVERGLETSEFPVLDIYFEKRNPGYKVPYTGLVRYGRNVLGFADFEYEERDGVTFYEGYLEFDANKYEFLEKKDKINILIEFD